MSRTDELRGSGARERGGGGGAPFVRWPDEYTWLEGEVLGLGESRFGPFVTVAVEDAGGQVTLEAKGTDDDGADYTVRVEDGLTVNVGLKLATLKGKFTEEDVGRTFHIAFENWQAPQGGGDPYRVFTVLDLTEDESAGESSPGAPSARQQGRKPTKQEKRVPGAASGGPGAPGTQAPPTGHPDGPPVRDDLPF